MSNTRALAGLTYHVKTFGCQMNLHDSERVSGLLASQGCFEVATPEEADIVVFMTCSVREKADTHLYGQVSATVSMPAPPSGKRIVCIGGCIAQRDGVAIREHMRNVDVVFGTRAIASLPSLIEESLEAYAPSAKDRKVYSDTSEDSPLFSTDLPSKRDDAWHAWVPIMTGCNNFCSYCIVPYVRGRERDREFESIVKEVRGLKALGVREVCLLGQNVNSYGRQLYGAPRFDELLRAVGETGIERIRFTSSNPKDLSDKTIAAMAETPNVMNQLHLAVQSGSTRILKAMNRKYTREEYLDLAHRIKAANPGIALSTDLIVGFPGETEEDFEDTLSLVKEVGFASAFTFIYSKRPGTPAAKIEDLTPHEVIQERFDRLAKLVEDLAFEANQEAKDQLVEVLVEGTSKRDDNILVGHTQKNKTCLFGMPDGYCADALVGKLVDVQVAQARTWYLRGAMVGDPR